MDVLFLIGRILVGGYYLYNAGNHLIWGTSGLTQYAASKNVPQPRLAVYVAGILLLIGGLSFLLGFRPEIGVAAIVLFFIPVTLMMHNFWADTDPMAKMTNMVMFSKNTGLMGSALMFLMIPQPWLYCVGC